MISVKKLLGKIMQCPMVIDSGTTTSSTSATGTVTTITTVNWKYKKWSDGRYELWGIVGSISYPMTSAYGYGYWCAVTVPFPTGFQFMPDFVSVNRGVSDGYDLINLEVSTTTSTYVSYYAFDTYSDTRTYNAVLYITGFYK